jgi:predicted HicB family RNase H-like nuclease
MSTRDGRLHLRVPEDIKAWAIASANKRNMTLSALIIQLLVELRDSEHRAQQPQEAEQV